MHFDVLTLFPEMFTSYLGQSLLAKAIERGLVEVDLHNIRDWSTDPKHHKVDDQESKNCHFSNQEKCL